MPAPVDASVISPGVVTVAVVPLSSRVAVAPIDTPVEP